jgi:hypothetical protein
MQTRSISVLFLALLAITSALADGSHSDKNSTTPKYFRIPNWLKVHRWARNIREWDPLRGMQLEWSPIQSFQNRSWIGGSVVPVRVCLPKCALLHRLMRRLEHRLNLSDWSMSIRQTLNRAPWQPIPLHEISMVES